jgi:lipoprotein-releasing system permease protein
MDPTTFIARRYLQAGKTNRFFSWISVLTISGVAIGVAAMIVVWSVINGFETELRRRFLTANAHIMAYRFPHGMANPDEYAQTISSDFKSVVRGVSPFIHYETMARKESILNAVLVRGIDPERRAKVQTLAVITRPPEALDVLQEEITEAKAGKPVPPIPSVIVGTGLLSLLDAEVGDVIELVEPEKNDLGSMKKFKVIGVYDSGLKHYDNKLVLMSIPTAQHFFGMGDRVTGLEIGLAHPNESPRIADEMASKYTLSIREWQSFNRPLFEAMEMERVVILLITAIIAAVASFNILTTIFVAVSQKQRDISILKAIGASNGFVLTLFLKQGAWIGLVGGLVGMVLAVGITKLLESYQFVDLPDLYLLARLPVSYDWWVYLGVATLSLAIAVVAGLFPAWLASRVDPVDGFRGNHGLGG